MKFLLSVLALSFAAIPALAMDNFVLEDEIVGTLFDIFVKEVDWNKVKLSKADKYYFRAKYFKVDHPVYDY